MVVTTNKEPLHCYISYANEHDASAAKKYLPLVKLGSTVIGDKGYVSKKLELYLKSLGINLMAIKRANMGNDSEYLTDLTQRYKKCF